MPQPQPPNGLVWGAGGEQQLKGQQQQSSSLSDTDGGSQTPVKGGTASLTPLSEVHPLAVQPHPKMGLLLTAAVQSTTLCVLCASRCILETHRLFVDSDSGPEWQPETSDSQSFPFLRCPFSGTETN